MRAVFSLNFDYFATPIIVAGLYLIGSSIIAFIALVIEAEAFSEAFGHSLSSQNPLMPPGWALVLVFLLPWIWFLVQVMLRVLAEAAVALVKIAENTSR